MGRLGRPNYLFSDGDLGSALRSHIDRGVHAVDDIDEARFKHQGDAEITREVVLKFSIRPLELLEQQRSMSKSDIKIDVSGDPNRNIFQRPGPIYLNAVRIVVSAPFLGDPGLWKLRPNAFRSVLPTGEVHGHGDDGGMLDITIEQPSETDAGEIKRHLDQEFETIRFYIANQRKQIEAEAPQLESRIAAAVASRRQRLAKHDSLSDILGIPLAPPQNQPPARPTPLARPQRRLASRAAERNVQWDVFISHASEDKDDFARPLAEALRAAGYSVWFDEFTLTVGDSLRRSIDKGLANSRFGVVIISPAFLRKEWPQKELDGLVAREVDGLKVILPVWHKIDRQGVVAISPALGDKLATNSVKGLQTVVSDLIAAMQGGGK